MQNTKKSRISLVRMVSIALMAALVFALSWVQIPLGDQARVHLGNVMCLLSGVLFGPLAGGLASGIGSMFFDFTNPLYISEFWITFIMKFAMGFVAGGVYQKLHEKLPLVLRNVLPALCGSLTYIALYMVKSIIWQRFVYGLVWDAVWPVVGLKGVTSLINGILAVVGCTVLAPALRAALQRTGVLKKPS